jgi:hypothetical protein
MNTKAIIEFAEFCDKHGYEWYAYDENDCRIHLTVLVSEASE